MRSVHTTGSAGTNRVVVLDMAGTTVVDGGAVEAAFLQAAADIGVGADSPRRASMLQYVRSTMGQSKIEVFTHLLDGDRVLAARANDAFERAYAENLDSCRPIAGAEQAIDSLREQGDLVALVTGFSSVTQQAIVDVLGWHDRVDLLLSPSAYVRGRPSPDLPLTALMRLRSKDVRQLVVVGDTTSDVLSGVRAGAPVVVGVLTGAHRGEDLRACGATHILDSVAQLPVALREIDDRADRADVQSS